MAREQMEKEHAAMQRQLPPGMNFQERGLQGASGQSTLKV